MATISTAGGYIAGSTPRHQFGLRSLLDIDDRWQLDAQFRHHTPIRQIPDIVTGEGIQAYSELDIRAAWHATQAMEVSLVGQNLLHPQHAEFGAPAARGEIERTVYAKLAWGFCARHATNRPIRNARTVSGLSECS